MAAMERISARAQGAFLRGVLALPRPLLRVIAGRPVTLDGQTLDLETQVGLRLRALSGEVPLAEMTPEVGRAQVQADAAAVAGPPIPVGGVQELTLDGGQGPIRGRLYTPDAGPAGDQDASALLIYFHGGGFVTGDLDTHANVARFFVRHAGVRVLAVDYRRAPEHPFPAAHEDAVAAFGFAVAHADELGVDPARIAVGGDSAGGNLAAGIAQATAGEDHAPALQLLVYPWLDLSSKRRSYELFREGFYLTEADLDWYGAHYLGADGDPLDPRCSPLLAEDLGGVAPAYVVTAGFDPLRDEGEEYAARLAAAGVPVALRRHAGLVHGFINTTQVGRSAREAVLEASGALRFALAVNPVRPRAAPAP